MRHIRSEMKARGTTAIIVTHDERITQYADRTVHIVGGQLDDAVEHADGRATTDAN